MRGNNGSDWNGNRKKDAFDHFMNMKVATKVSSSTEETISKKNDNSVGGITMGGKVIYDAKKDSNAVVILKSLLVVSLCIAGIFIPVSAEMESIAVALFPLGAVGLSVLLLRNT